MACRRPRKRRVGDRVRLHLGHRRKRQYNPIRNNLLGLNMSTTATILERELEWAPGEDLPYVMHLPGQRALALTIPAAWVVLDKTGEVCLRPPAVHWLDKLRALYSRL